MRVDTVRTIARKAMAYDLGNIIHGAPCLEPDTVRAVIKIMEDYIDREIAVEQTGNGVVSF